MKVVFLDRDGVINKEVNYLHKVEDFEYTNMCIQALKNIIAVGYEIAIITNQAGIARGIFREEDYQSLTKYLLDDLLKNNINILNVLFCPHLKGAEIKEYDVDCFFRKPNPGMIIKLSKEHGINLRESILVGDKATDLEAGISAGIQGVYLVESGHQLSKEDYYKYPVFKDLYEFSLSLI